MTGKRWRVYVFVGAVLLCTSAAACGRSQGEWVVATPAGGQSGEQVHITGVVKRYEVEGGFYAIRGEDGVTYDPTNLPPGFQKDGLAVEAEARRRSDAMGIHQVGTIVELVRIRPR